MRLLSALIAFMALPSTSFAYGTGLDLLRDCAHYEGVRKNDPKIVADPTTILAFGRCSGYLQGIHDANQLVFGLKGRQSALYCSPVTLWGW
jgi:hypothetical protein